MADTEFNPETLSDDEHDELMDAMINGTLDSQLTTEAEDATIGDEEVTDNEDTDQEDESEEESATNLDTDGDLEDTDEAADEDEEEDTLVETDSDESNDEDDEEEEEDADAADDSETEDLDDEDQDTTETSEADVDLTPEQADGIDYKAFYDAVTATEFTVNGKKTHGFKDPKKIIQAQQMAGGFSDKMAGFKKYRPYMAPLQERGMLEDTDKFNLAMKLIDGDPEAIKQHLKNLEIDPLDIEMDEINYVNQNTLASQEQLVLEDSLETAKAAGFEDEVRQVIGKDWDQDSFNEYLHDGQIRADLLDHIQSGAYGYVQERIQEFKRLDVNGTFSSMNTLDQYRAAAKDIQQELSVNEASRIASEARQNNAQQAKADNVATEKARIAKSRKETEFKAKADKQNAKVAERRKNAASVSKRKSKAPVKAAKFDPMKLEGEEFDELMNAMINGDIK